MIEVEPKNYGKMNYGDHFCVANVAKFLRFHDFTCLAISEYKYFLKRCNIAV